MPYDGSGNFNRALGPDTWQNDAAAGIKIKSDLHDNNDNDIASGLSNVICKDGQSSPTADIGLNGHKLINVANPINPQDAMTLSAFTAGAVRYDAAQALTPAQQLTAHTNLAATLSVLPKAANYTLLQADRAKLLFITATMNLTLPAASAVGNDFAFFFRVQGGVMTLVPNGTNQIEGINANLPVPSGSSGIIWCDGTQWFMSLNARAPFQAKAANYTAVMGDNGSTLVFSAAATLSLTAAATLKTGWWLTVIAPATADIIVDPNAAETIDGAATITVRAGQSCVIFCDGANFVTNKAQNRLWEKIGEPVVVAAGTASVIWTGLSPYRRIRVAGFVRPTTTGAVNASVSTDNGATWLAGAGDYFVQYQAATGTGGSVANALSQSTLALTTTGIGNASNDGLRFCLELDDFNQAKLSWGTNQSLAVSASSTIANLGNICTGVVARNAFRIMSAAGTLAQGILTMEGIRG